MDAPKAYQIWKTSHHLLFQISTYPKKKEKTKKNLIFSMSQRSSWRWSQGLLCNMWMQSVCYVLSLYSCWISFHDPLNNPVKYMQQTVTLMSSHMSVWWFLKYKILLIREASVFHTWCASFCHAPWNVCCFILDLCHMFVFEFRAMYNASLITTFLHVCIILVELSLSFCLCICWFM